MKNLILFCLCCGKEFKPTQIPDKDSDFFCSVGCMQDYENNLKFEFIDNKEKFNKRLKDLQIEKEN